MGYTHYWTIDLPIPWESWEAIVTDARKLFASTAQPIQFEYDNASAPVADDARIRFNGRGDNGYETFVFDRYGEQQSCKTGGRPYDVVVCAVLAAVHDRAPKSVTVESDGDANDWAPALAWGSLVLGRTLRFPVCAQAST